MNMGNNETGFTFYNVNMKIIVEMSEPTNCGFIED